MARDNLATREINGAVNVEAGPQADVTLRANWASRVKAPSTNQAWQPPAPGFMQRLRPALSGCLVAALGLLALGLPASAAAQTDEAALKAQFLFKFTAYITWPEPTDGFHICALGEGPVIATLKQIVQDEQIAGQPVTVHTVSLDSDRRACHLVWLGSHIEHGPADVWARLGGPGVLLVSDKHRAIHDGAAIGLLRVEGKIRFEVDASALERADLLASAQLLKLGRPE